MAAGSGEEENYWPGYVDALTTMTMVLTFILMVLGITIFSLSQNVSRSYLESIASAAGMSGGGASSLDELKDRIIKALEAEHRKPDATPAVPVVSREPPGAPALLPPVEQATSPSVTADAATKAGPKSGGVPVPGDLAGEPKPSASGTDTGVGHGSLGSRGEAMSSVKPEQNPVDPAKVVENKLAADPPPPAAPRFKSSDAALTIVYRPRTMQLDDNVKAELRRFAESAETRRPGASIVVRGYASIDGSLSENRRAALIRAMVVRSALIEAGVSGTAVTIRVEDSADKSRAESVQLFRS